MAQTNTKKKYARPRRPRVATANTPTPAFNPDRPDPDPADLAIVDDDACLTQVDDTCLTQVDDTCLTQVDDTSVTDVEDPPITDVEDRGWPDLDDPIWAELGDLDWPRVEDVSRPEVEAPTATAVNDMNPAEPVELFRPKLRLVE